MERFSRAYWSQDIRRPALSTALAFLIAPLPIVALAMVAGWSLELMVSGDAEFATNRIVNISPVVLAVCYAILLTLGMIAFALLWMFGRGGAIDYGLTGAIVGAVAAALAPVFDSDLPLSPIAMAVFAMIFLLIFLTLRWIAGIRPLSGRQ